MNRIEQKEVLKDILIRTNDLKIELSEKEKEIEKAYFKISELGDLFEDIGQPESWDEEQLKQDMIAAIIENSTMSEIYDELYDFKSELEEYMEELSESRREKLEERYQELESALEMLEHDDTDESIENVIERIIDAEVKIKEML